MDTHNHAGHGIYRKLALMAVLSFGVMYLFMYAMVNVWGNVFPNHNQFYMAGLMVSPMVILELILMRSMYPDKKWNSLLIFAGIILLILFWIGIRQQIAINDEQFLKSMIPHHAGAILMCQKASIEDEEIKELCQNIIAGQQAEINFMKAKLNQ